MGAGYAFFNVTTNISRVFVFFACLAMIIHYFNVVQKDTLNIRNLFSIDSNTILKMFLFGIPSGGQRVLEVALFSTLTFFSTALTIAETAAHHIAKLILNFCHNFPIAFSSAATFRLGKFLGKGELEKAKLSGFSTIVWGTLFMALCASALFFIPGYVMGMFTNDPEVIICVRFLGICVKN